MHRYRPYIVLIYFIYSVFRLFCNLKIHIFKYEKWFYVDSRNLSAAIPSVPQYKCEKYKFFSAETLKSLHTNINPYIERESCSARLNGPKHKTGT